VREVIAFFRLYFKGISESVARETIRNCEKRKNTKNIAKGTESGIINKFQEIFTKPSTIKPPNLTLSTIYKCHE
jgi:hypothetical protein